MKARQICAHGENVERGSLKMSYARARAQLRGNIGLVIFFRKLGRINIIQRRLLIKIFGG